MANWQGSGQKIVYKHFARKFPCDSKDQRVKYLITENNNCPGEVKNTQHGEK